MNNKLLLTIYIFLLSTTSNAQKWVPKSIDSSQEYRLLECKYDKAQLKYCQPIISSSNTTSWKVDVQKTTITNGIKYSFDFIAQKDMNEVGVAVAFDQYQWSSDNYVMIPASVYNGNRQRIVNREYATGLDKTDYYRKDLALTSNPIPQLSPEYGAPSRIEVNVCNAATPAIAYLDRNKKSGIILLTDQGIVQNNQILDHGLIIEETADRSIASFVISAPGVREKKPEFIGFSESPDRGISIRKGEKITIHITKLSFHCNHVSELLSYFMKYRKTHTVQIPTRNLIPMSTVFSLMVQNIDERYYKKDSIEFYCPENANWMSYGWIGGLINTYPILTLEDTCHLNKVFHTFDFALSHGQGSSGYFYDVLNADGTILNRDAAQNIPGIGLTRKNGDILYWMIKQFNLLKLQNREQMILPQWEKAIQSLANAFVSTWEKHKTWGNYIQVESGDVAVYNTTGGAIAIAGMVLASQYFQEPRYLEIAQEAADYYYKNFFLTGFTSGGCGDILQNADSETAIALTTSLMTLYEATQEKKYLQQAQDLANLCATWTVSFPYQLPSDTPLARLNANLTGAVWASTQNKHGAPGFCTQSGDVLFKLYRATNDTLYADLLKDVIHAHTEGIQPNGKITERLTYCDADSRGSRGDGGKTGWNETNGALMALEIPSIYIRTDINRLYVFDHVNARITKENEKYIWIEINNPTSYDATVTIMTENAQMAKEPLGDHAFLSWKNKVKVPSKEEITYKIDRK